MTFNCINYENKTSNSNVKVTAMLISFLKHLKQKKKIKKK